MIPRRYFYFAFLIAGMMLGMGSGCGYTDKTVLPQNIRTIHVNTVQNKVPVRETYAYVHGLEIDITNAVIRRFLQDGNLRVVAREQADAVLEMDLIRFEQEGLRFTSLESVAEYRVFIVLNLKLIDTQTGSIILEEANFSGDSDYFVSLVPSLNREEAAREAVDRLALNLVDRIVEDW